MRKLLRIFVLCAFCTLCASHSKGALKTFYSKVVVTSDSEGGLVSVSDNSNTPASAASMEKTQSKFEFTASSTTHTYYLKAAASEGYVFAGWYLNNALYSGEAELTEAITTSNSDKNNPLTRTYTAHFIEKPAVTVECASSVVVVKADPEVSHVGDEVTLTASIAKLDWLGNPQYTRNLMFEFDCWTDTDGNVLSHDPVYTFTVTEPVTVVARAKDLSEKPANGKYYRIRNMSNRVLSLEGNYKLSLPSGLSSGVQADYSLLRWALPADHVFDDFPIFTTGNRYEYTDDDPALEVESCPSTIFYITGTPDGANLKNVSLASQGVSSYNMMGAYLTIKPMSSAFPGYYYFFATSTLRGDAGVKMRLQYVNSKYPACDVYVGNVTDTDSYSGMAVQPIDEEHMDHFWFGALPDEAMEFEGGYWTSMYTAFPYECRDGVEAYIVKEATTANGVAYACLTRIEGDRVPANTAVLLKCLGLTTKENRLLPLAPETEISPVEGNALQGVYQLFASADKDGRKQFDESTMRVLGVNSKGETGFFKLSAGADGAPQELKANRAYLDMSLLPGVKAASAFRLKLGNSSSAIDAIDASGDPVRFEDMRVFDLSGRPVTLPVPGTVYIVNGRKMLWK